ncbi:MAG: ATP synthase F1 subunit epsilon [Dehalococcoidia bacterium]
MPLSLSIVTADRTVLERDDVQRLVVPTTEGQITILPSHAALMASLTIGEMIVYVPDGPIPLAIHGGFIQVVKDEVSVLADGAERAEEIDEARAEAARERARARLEGRMPVEAGALDLLRAQLALQRALIRLRVHGRRRSPTGAPSMR